MAFASWSPISRMISTFHLRTLMTGQKRRFRPISTPDWRRKIHSTYGDRTTALKNALLAAGERVGELVWPMPLLEIHKSAMRGRVADLANISSPAVGAGSVTGAAFLSNFVSDSTEWCHLDIAGTAWGAAQRDWVGGAQGTGVGTRLLIEYLETRK